MSIINKMAKGLFIMLPWFAAVFLTPQALAQGGTWQTKAPMPMSIVGGVAGVIDGKLYAIGGNGTNLVSVNEAYDPATNSWSYKSPSPVLRVLAAGGVIGGKLYIAGGCIGFDCRVGLTNLLEAYDAATGTWSTLAPMPTARNGTGAIIDGKLYVVGGEAACPPCVPQYGTLEVYDPATDSWTTKQPMPAPRMGAAASAIGGKLYVVGGYVRSPSYAMTNILEVYDPATDTWITAAPMPTARHASASVALNGKMHVLGGANSSGAALATHEVYDPAANTWATEVPMPTARWHSVSGAVGPTLYVVGGDIPAGGGVNANEAFTPFTTVEIDIKPGSDVNPINPDSQGRIAVAILSTATFDATHVDTSTLHFGTATVVTATVEDVNGDGRPDIVLHFNTTDVGIACGDISATLTGSTLFGQLIQGSDVIRTVGCK